MVKNIYNHVFSNSGITSIYAPIVENIFQDSFLNCNNLSNITLSKNTKFNMGNPFGGCSTLKSFTLVGNTGSLGLAYGSALISDFMYLDAKLIAWPTSVSNPITYVYGIQTIGHAAFKGNKNHLNLKFDYNLKIIEHGAFDGCTGLVEIEALTLENIRTSAFLSCTNLTKINIPGIMYIDTNAFGSTGGTPLEITMGFTSPGANGAFNGITVPKNVTLKVPAGSLAAGNYNATWQENFTWGNTNINFIIVEY